MSHGGDNHEVDEVGCLRAGSGGEQKRREVM